MIVAAPRLWRGRRALVTPVTVLAAAVFASLALSTVFAGDGVPTQMAGRLAIQLSLVIAGAAIWGGGPLADARPLIERAAFAIAVISSLVTLIGGLLAVLQLTPGFTDFQDHPTFGTWPRLVGGVSYSAETCGLVAVAAAAVLLRRRLLFWLPALAAIGTLAIGGTGLALVAALRLKRARTIALAVAALVLIALQWPVHRAHDAPCDAYPNHVVQWHDDAGCHVRPITRYALAKLHSVEIIEDHPLLGVGYLGFERHAAADLHAENPYLSTHGSWLGIAAEQGVLGLALAIALTIAVAQALRRGRADPACLIVTALLVGYVAASLDLDIHKARLLWLAIGASAGLGRARA